jgi:hypothetical protein
MKHKVAFQIKGVSHMNKTLLISLISLVAFFSSSNLWARLACDQVGLSRCLSINQDYHRHFLSEIDTNDHLLDFEKTLRLTDCHNEALTITVSPTRYPGLTHTTSHFDQKVYDACVLRVKAEFQPREQKIIWDRQDEISRNNSTNRQCVIDNGCMRP